MALELRRWYTISKYYEFIKSLTSPYVKIHNLTPKKNLPIYSLELTNKTIDDSQKQNVLITAMHSGVEYSGANTVIYFLKWLLGDSLEAKNFLCKYKIVLIPIPNPYIYEKGDITLQHKSELSNDPYFEPWTLDGVSDVDINWEAYTIQKEIDKLLPDLLIDCHGVFFKGQTMIENTGTSVNGMSRPHNNEFIRLLNKSASEKGYHVEDIDLRQKVLSVNPNIFGRKYNTCAYGINPCTYAYHNYHTLSSVMEIGNEESGFIRLKKALEIGLTRWDGEKTIGYPVNKLYGEGFHSIHPLSEIYSIRRKERISIWNNIDQFSLATIQPQIPGTETFLLLCDDISKSLENEIPYGMDIETFSEYFSNCAIKKYLIDTFKNRYMSFNLASIPKTYSKPFTVGIRIPYKNAEIISINVNGQMINPKLFTHVKYTYFSIVFVDFKKGFTLTTIVDIKYSIH